jgi:uncharacterized protein YrrD
MQFKEGTRVYTVDGRDVGTVDRVVLDPRNNKVSGIVVRKGWLFTEDKVVPIEMVDVASEDRVTLLETKHDLQELPEFQDTYYIPAYEEDYKGVALPHPPHAMPFYSYPPVGVAWWGVGTYMDYPVVEPEYVVRTDENIPDNTIALSEGARVVDLDGKHVGDVEELFFDSESKRVTHLLISKGILFKEHKLIPGNWIEVMGEDEVSLHVPTKVVEALPEYQAQ